MPRTWHPAPNTWGSSVKRTCHRFGPLLPRFHRLFAFTCLSPAPSSQCQRQEAHRERCAPQRAALVPRRPDTASPASLVPSPDAAGETLSHHLPPRATVADDPASKLFPRCGNALARCRSATEPPQLRLSTLSLRKQPDGKHRQSDFSPTENGGGKGKREPSRGHFPCWEHLLEGTPSLGGDDCRCSSRTRSSNRRHPTRSPRARNQRRTSSVPPSSSMATLTPRSQGLIHQLLTPAPVWGSTCTAPAGSASD